MSTSRRFIVFVLTSLLCGIFATGCDEIISDPNFHTWCGDQLCSWKLESGQIRRAPTWHPKDYGVELLDSTDATHVTAISQIVNETPQCLEFTTLADVAAEAQVSVAVDFNADGTIEYEQTISAVGFREQKAQVTAPSEYASIKFTILKKGTGRAVFAQMEVRSKTDCTGQPVPLKPQALGTPCSEGRHGFECISKICCDGFCAECCVQQTLPPSHRDDEDAGVPRNPSDTCEEPETCGSVSGFPHQCDPGTKKRPARSECLFDEDCESDRCEGAKSENNGKTFVHAGICR